MKDESLFPPLPPQKNKQTGSSQPSSFLMDVKNTIWHDPAFHRLVLILSIITIFMAACYLLFGRTCIFQLIFGLPCPGCGLFHAGIDLMTFHFDRALASNPTILLWVPLIIWTVIAYFRHSLRSRWFTAFLIFTCVVTILVYAYRMATVFPQWPMDRYADCLLARMSRLAMR